MRTLLKTLTISLTLLATACGWQLRGALTLPADLNSVYISARDSYGGIAQELKRSLKTNKVAVTERSSQAQLNIHLIEVNSDRRTASVSSGGLASEYELSLEVTYKVTDSQGKLLLEKDTATVIRSYRFDPNSVNSAAAEERILKQEMRRDVSGQIIRRLQFVKLATTAEATTNTDSP